MVGRGESLQKSAENIIFLALVFGPLSSYHVICMRHSMPQIAVFRIKAGVLLLPALLTLLLFSGVFAQDRPASTPRTGTDVSALKDYRIAPLDTISITVFQEPELTRDVKVSQTGYITFPLLGKVAVAGLLVSEVETRIAGLLGKDYIKNPQVSAMVKEYSVRRISVMGEVKKPGSYEIPPEERLTLLQAIARAEGFTNIAKTDSVVISRIKNDKEERIEVNATEMMKSKGEKKDVDLQPGDIIVVPQRFF